VKKKIAIIASSVLVIAVLLVLLWPPHVEISVSDRMLSVYLGTPAYASSGMKQLIIGGYNNALSNSGTEYSPLGGGYSWSSTATARQQVVSTPGTFSDFAVELSAAPGNGGSYTIALLNVTQSTSLAVTITDPATTNINAGTLAVATGDIVELQSTYADAPSATPSARWSVMFEGDNTKESLILGGGYTNTGADRYAPIMHGSPGSSSATEAATYQVIPTSGTIKNLFVALNITPGEGIGDAYRYTLMKYTPGSPPVGGATSLTVTITKPDTAGSDTSNSVAVAAGDYVCMLIEPLNTPSNTPLSGWGFTFVADTNGESLILGQSSDTPTLGSTEYNYLTTTYCNNAWSGSEYYQGGQLGITLKKFYAMLSDTSTQDYDLNVRATSASGDTGIAATITAGNTTGNDTVNTYAIGDYDELSISCLATAGGTARMVYWGLVCYIPGITPPTVTNSTGESNVTQTKARLNGELTDDGGENCTVHVYWGDNDGETTPGNWDHAQDIGSQAAGTFYYDATGLIPNTNYYYRCYAVNSAGDDWADSTEPLTTLDVDIENTPESYDFGMLVVGTSSATAIDHFTVTNIGDGAVDITIHATDFTGGDDTWDLADTGEEGIGDNIYALYAGLDDDDDEFDVIVRESLPYNTLTGESGLGGDESQDWGLKLYMPTAVTGYDGQEMEATVTLVASPH
jgi:hypothetical protein